MENIKLNITGMTCGHCELAVKNAMEDIQANVTNISAKENFAEISFDPQVVTLETIKQEITDAGFSVV